MKSLKSISSTVSTHSGGDPGIPPKRRTLTWQFWRGILSLAAIAAVFSVTPEAVARGTLRPGLAGPEVARLQAALGIHVDGLYGRQTTSAVAAFQRACGLLVDGIAGPQTLSSLYGGGCSGGYVPIAEHCGDPCYSSGRFEGYYDEDDRYDDYRHSDDCEGEYPCYPPNRINELGNRFPSRAYAGGQYVVVVPDNGPEDLTRVRRYVPTAFPDATLAGGFINAGQFNDYATAARTVDLLEGVGFNAQVAYREYYDD
jgi:hypothetical protein